MAQLRFVADPSSGDSGFAAGGTAATLFGWYAHHAAGTSLQHVPQAVVMWRAAAATDDVASDESTPQAAALLPR